MNPLNAVEQIAPPARAISQRAKIRIADIELALWRAASRRPSLQTFLSDLARELGVLQRCGVAVAAACAVAALASPSARAANVPLCLAIAQNYNNCVRQHQMGGHYRQGYRYGHGDGDGPYGDEGGYGGYPSGGHGGYGGGYGGGGGGYGGDDGPGYGGGYGGPGYGGYGRQERAKAACAVWFAQMQASGCFD